jgi:hypothetical protein
VEIPNTNIASNLGPQIDPKDVDYLQVERGGYGAAEGDRTWVDHYFAAYRETLPCSDAGTGTR